jgi:hypothetical protein
MTLVAAVLGMVIHIVRGLDDLMLELDTVATGLSLVMIQHMAAAVMA